MDVDALSGQTTRHKHRLYFEVLLFLSSGKCSVDAVSVENEYPWNRRAIVSYL